MREQLLDIMLEAFGDADRREWETACETIGIENLRSVERNGALAGGLILVPMGQFFGGRSVPMTGIGAVAVAPEHRGTGAATELMCEVVREMHGNGIALSALFPATEPLYRRAGYEQGGVKMQVRLKLSSIGFRDRELSAKRVDDTDMDAVRAIHMRRAAGSPGNIDRNDYNWYEIRKKATGFLFGDEGYVFYREIKLPGELRKVLLVTDFAATTPSAMRRVLTFLRDHISLREDALLFVGPSDPLLAGITEQRYTPRYIDHWMLRLTHVQAAFEARGYAKGIDAQVHLRVSDDVCAGNAGDWVLRVADGSGKAERGGRGDVEIDVRALASLYSGHLSVATLRTIGWIDGPSSALEAAQTVFAGPAPWMSDGF